MLPVAILDASIPTNIVSMSFAVRHALRALLGALWGRASGTVRVTIREAESSLGLEECVGRKDKFNLPVGISPS